MWVYGFGAGRKPVPTPGGRPFGLNGNVGQKEANRFTVHEGIFRRESDEGGQWTRLAYRKEDSGVPRPLHLVGSASSSGNRQWPLGNGEKPER